MTKLRFHLLGLAHLETHTWNSSCAYTQKIIKLAKMIKEYGHTIYFYGVKGSEVSYDKFIPVSSQEVLKRTYGDMTGLQISFSTIQQTLHFFILTGMPSRQFWKTSKTGIYFCAPWEITRNRLQMRLSSFP